MIDKLDADLIALLTTEPRLGVFEASRRLGVARGTVQARLDRLQRSGVVRDFAPTVDTDRLGYPVTAFVTASITELSARSAAWISGWRARWAATRGRLPSISIVRTTTLPYVSTVVPSRRVSASISVGGRR